MSEKIAHINSLHTSGIWCDVVALLRDLEATDLTVSAKDLRSLVAASLKFMCCHVNAASHVSLLCRLVKRHKLTSGLT